MEIQLYKIIMKQTKQNHKKNSQTALPIIETHEVSWTDSFADTPHKPLKWQSVGSKGDDRIYGDPCASPEKAIDSLRKKCESTALMAKILLDLINRG